MTFFNIFLKSAIAVLSYFHLQSKRIQVCYIAKQMKKSFYLIELVINIPRIYEEEITKAG